jgi:hypothetical protein
VLLFEFFNAKTNYKHPMTINYELEDLFIGTLFGQAVDDALSLDTEFMSKKYGRL